VCDHPQMHKHPQRDSIDEALVNGTPYRSVAKRCDYLRVRCTVTRLSIYQLIC
jgi:hypothetical protein